MAQVFLGMSGGVDSSAAAVLLQAQGYAVSGLHLSLLSGLPLPAGRLPDDGSDARAVASLLGLPFYDMDLSPEFRATVIDYFIREYEAGRTPNPCVFCNRRDVYKRQGLGLPLCRAIAEKHGGSITVESAPGKGSRFMVTLPDRQLGSQLSDIPSVYNGGFSRPLLGLADALPSDAFAVRNLE